MEMIVIALLVIVLIVSLVTLVFARKAIAQKDGADWRDMKYKLDNVLNDIARIEQAVKNEMVINRRETGDNTQRIREELAASLKNFSELITAGINNFNTHQKDNFFALLNKQSEQNTHTVTRLDQLRETLERKIADMQTGNERKLDEMRATVDEKLQKTLETRLGESFKLVSERLEAVHKGLGDMQQLATGVGDLKRVLTNVKTRGVLGEYQLENMLEQLLTPDQYARNVKTKDGSNALVEFAVKLPGRGDKEKMCWLPIDSKFPKEDFESLTDAYDQALPELVEEYRQRFVKGIRKCAVDIASRYIDPPNTTDFAILFLPFESLYAEVLRTPGLFESIQRENRIVITGPTTLSALLNSLQMGFRTLAIEKRSGEVWQLLGAVKTEFGNFGGILEKTQKKLQEASNVIEQAGIRSRAIERKLRTVQELPKEEAVALIGEPGPGNGQVEDE
jgi:DNA recombination protein RmuC